MGPRGNPLAVLSGVGCRRAVRAAGKGASASRGDRPASLIIRNG
jgi:hypothetical protein